MLIIVRMSVHMLLLLLRYLHDMSLLILSRGWATYCMVVKR